MKTITLVLSLMAVSPAWSNDPKPAAHGSEKPAEKPADKKEAKPAEKGHGEAAKPAAKSEHGAVAKAEAKKPAAERAARFDVPVASERPQQRS